MRNWSYNPIYNCWLGPSCIRLSACACRLSPGTPPHEARGLECRRAGAHSNWSFGGWTGWWLENPVPISRRKVTQHMGVETKIGGFTPKSSILIGFSIINHPFWGTIIFGNTHILYNYSTGKIECWVQRYRCIAYRKIHACTGWFVAKITFCTKKRMYLSRFLSYHLVYPICSINIIPYLLYLPIQPSTCRLIYWVITSSQLPGTPRIITRTLLLWPSSAAWLAFMEMKTSKGPGRYVCRNMVEYVV